MKILSSAAPARWGRASSANSLPRGPRSALVRSKEATDKLPGRSSGDGRPARPGVGGEGDGGR